MQKLLVAILIITSVYCDSALSVNAKIYSATGCVYEKSSFSHSYKGTLMNISPTIKKVICPIIRDMPVLYQGITETWANVLDQSLKSDIVCWINRSYPSGKSYSSSWKSASTQGSMNPTWGSIAFAYQPESHYTANYTLECNVPGVDNGKRSGIGNYRIEEH